MIDSNSLRHALLEKMFRAYGQEPTSTRIAIYLETIGPCSDALLAIGISEAMRATDSEFAPGPGTILRHIRANAQTRPGDAPSPSETARDTAARLGQGTTAPKLLGPLFDGLASRIKHNYAKVVRRSKEIARERNLPHCLDTTLWTLGEAERELHFVDPVQDAKLERSLAQQRRNAGRRLGVLS